MLAANTKLSHIYEKNMLKQKHAEVFHRLNIVFKNKIEFKNVGGIYIQCLLIRRVKQILQHTRFFTQLLSK